MSSNSFQARFPFLLVAAAAWFACSLPRAAAEHPISITEAQAFVTASRVRMRIQLFAEDLFLFQGLEPNDQDVIEPDQLRKGLDQHRDFLLDKVQILDATGKALFSDVTDLQPFDIPDEGIPVTELMLHSATYQLEFEYDEPPEFLTFEQSISDENFIYPSEMKITIHQAGTDLTIQDSLKPGNSKTVRFDWSDQQPGDDSSEKEWDAWFEKQREATLGITSYSSVYSFIYVEPAEVRHEVLIPLATLKEILPLEHADPAFITVEEQVAVRKQISAWLASKNPTKINGQIVPAEFTRIDFYGLDLKDFARQAEAREVSLSNGRAGIIMTYRPSDDVVRDVDVSWNAFSSALRKVEAVIFTESSKPQKFEFSRFKTAKENQFLWQVDPSTLPVQIASVSVEYPARKMLRISIPSLFAFVLALVVLFVLRGKQKLIAIGLIVVGAVLWPMFPRDIDDPTQRRPQVSRETADEVFEKLHAGMYRALDFGTEDKIYEVLESSVDGQLLEDLYLQLRESLKMKEQGGAVARVKQVELLEGLEMPSKALSVTCTWPGFAYRCTWTVSGTVEHWGHIHERNNEFTAEFVIEDRDGQWKITALQNVEQESLSARTRLRDF